MGEQSPLAPKDQHPMTEELTQTIYIDGGWRPAPVVEAFSVTYPSSGDVIGHASNGTRADAEEAIAAASAAFETWSRTTAYERASLLQKSHALLVERHEELAQLLTREQGKP